MSVLARAMPRIWSAACAAALVLALAPQAVFAQEIALAGSRLRFAGLDEAQAALGADDVWVQTTGNFQRAATLGVQGKVTAQQFRAGLAKAAQACTPEQQQRWRSAAASITPRLDALRIALPPSVMLVCTDGSDSANVPYTRAAAVFLPRNLNLGPYSDAELLAHELFHVLTRHDPGLATRLYATLGFQAADALEWPAEWADARISNPDAPHHRHFMRIDGPEGSVAVMPVLVARRTNLQPGETFFSVLDVRLLAVEPGHEGKPTRPIRRDGQLRWEIAQASPQYLSRLGGNTAYVFHPEETAADNFAFLVSGRGVRNPALLAQFEKVLLDIAAARNSRNSTQPPTK
jgi:hypothetical protein